ncbi:uncharacterized protein LOC118187604 [Stegodyphus dumicola]|uniref:uncharacterized protein LOC118187604 n=1 Tax=Stegodyphus dumicola TaxID=202533 RepID=UPI0015A7FB2B|nr:uncharacterized protein LOC118187604 [Stegodyphus dumicola]
MWFIISVLFFGLCSGQDQNIPPGMCQDFPFDACTPQNATKDDVVGLNQESFQEQCPMVKEFLRCLRTREEVCGVVIFDRPMVYDRIMNIVNDICDNSTSLHQAFIESIPCYKHAKDNLKQVCFDSKPDLFWTYEDFSAHHMQQDYLISETCKTSGTEYLNYGKLRCLNYVYVISCVADYAAAQCSSLARNVTVEFARRADYGTLGCSDRSAELLWPVIPNLSLTETMKQSLMRTLEGLL